MDFSLYLYPRDAGSSPQGESLYETLEQLGLTAGRDAQSAVFMAGPRLMELVTYLGCSPSLTEDDSGRRVSVHQFVYPTGMGGVSFEAVKFPGCGHRISNATDILALPLDAACACTECGASATVNQINWRKSAAYSTLFIEIAGIFPKEAVPGDELLRALKEATNSEWRWFYSESS